jgi:hypothetical protein
MTGTPVLALLGRIAEAETIDAAWGAGDRLLCRTGLCAAQLWLHPLQAPRTIGDPDDALFLTTCDADYAQRYFRGGFYARTPVFRWAERNTGACTWKWVAEAFAAGRLSDRRGRGGAPERGDGGKVAGISVSFPEASARAKGALGLIADPGLDHRGGRAHLCRARRDEIMAVANMMHLKIIQSAAADPGARAVARQREALEWVADGKTTQDVALLDGRQPGDGGKAPAAGARGAGGRDHGPGGGQGRALEHDLPAPARTPGPGRALSGQGRPDAG